MRAILLMTDTHLSQYGINFRPLSGSCTTPIGQILPLLRCFPSHVAFYSPLEGVSVISASAAAPSMLSTAVPVEKVSLQSHRRLFTSNTSLWHNSNPLRAHSEISGCTGLSRCLRLFYNSKRKEREEPIKDIFSERCIYRFSMWNRFLLPIL